MSTEQYRYLPYRLEVKAGLILEPCLHVGAGEQWHPGTDMPVARLGHVVYIPGSSLRGVLRHYLEERYDRLSLAMRDLFGYVEPQRGMQPGKGQAGRPAVADAMPLSNAASQPATEIRDYVRIDRRTGAAAARAKFDAEAVIPKQRFDFLLVYEGGKANDGALALLGTGFEALHRGDIRVGGKSGKGFGQVKLDKTQFWAADRSTEEGLLKFWEGRLGNKSYFPTYQWHPATPPDPQFQELAIRLKVEFDGPTLVQAALPPKPGQSGPWNPDHVFVSSAGKPYLPGASLRGVLSTQAEKIVTTLGLDGNTVFVPLFGEPLDEGQGRKGMLEVSDGSFISGEEVYLDHVALDRITQAAASGKKFSATALASPKFQVSIRLKYSPQEWRAAALAAFLVRDLCQGRLWAGGGTSRGYGCIRQTSIEESRLNGQQMPAQRWEDLKPWWGPLNKAWKEAVHAG